MEVSFQAIVLNGKGEDQKEKTHQKRICVQLLREDAAFLLDLSVRISDLQ